MIHGVELRLHSSLLRKFTGNAIVSLYDVYDNVVVRLLERGVRVFSSEGAWFTYRVGRALQEARTTRNARHITFAVRVQHTSRVPSTIPTNLPSPPLLGDHFSAAEVRRQPTLTTYGETMASYAKRRRTRRATNRRPQSSRGGRRRRRRRRKGKKNGQHKCRRRPLYVSFADVGWKDWIMAPVGYDAYYCSGRCKGFLADHMNATNHAIVRSLVHSVRIDTPVLEPCCVPTVLAPLTLLYTEKSEGGSNSVLKIYDDMIVKSCGCR